MITFKNNYFLCLKDQDSNNKCMNELNENSKHLNNEMKQKF